MVRAANKNGIIAPMNNPTRTGGLVILRLKTVFGESICTSEMYAAIKARAVRAAEPIAKPFPVAAVVFPRESRASVLSRTSSPSSDISAIPPALSAIGP